MWIFFVSQVVTISPCATNTQYALANKCSSLSLSLSHFPLSFPPFTHFLTLTLFRTQSLSLSHLSSAFFFFLLFTLMRGLKSSNKVCLLKNSSYSAFLLLRSRFFFLFFVNLSFSFSLFLTLTLSSS